MTHASNEYMETFEGQQLGSFRDGSDTYLTEEQYAMVKHVVQISLSAYFVSIISNV
jgi:hypothetical protein